MTSFACRHFLDCCAAANLREIRLHSFLKVKNSPRISLWGIF
jgi:hypothetical protein